ncbi:MAG: hypothetical protein Q8Q09_02055 [Deltaproteobacteria bacterium]|nr:hypothetical protein [Deltaproteobacteria bacterium]
MRVLHLHFVLLASCALAGALFSPEAHAQRARPITRPPPVAGPVNPAEIVPPIAAATAPTPENPRVAEGAIAREGELVFMIYASAPLPAWATTPARSASTAPIVDAEPPPPPVTWADVAARYNRGLVIGLQLGAGSPVGMAGAWIEAGIHRAIAARAAVGIDANFGPVIELGALARPWRFGAWAPVLGLSFSSSFVSQDYNDRPGLRVPANSFWLQPNAGIELRVGAGFVLRASVGASVMLNTGAFSNVAQNGWYGPVYVPDIIGQSPFSAADAHDRGMALVVPSIFFDVGYAVARY